MKCALVIPTYNERANIHPLIERIRATSAHLDLFFVDDASPDGTGEVLDSLRSSHPGLRVLHRSGKLGLGSAYRQAFHGLVNEGYDRIISMDADLSHPPEAIPDLLRRSEEVDLVIGSRYVPGGQVVDCSRMRQGLSRTANALARRLLGLSVRDVTSGFRCYRRELLAALDQVGIRSNGYSFLVEITYYTKAMGFRVGEVPILFHNRTLAKSKMGWTEVAKAILTLFRLVGQRAKSIGVSGLW
jgi:glycosyltransferase involved in cell wall biosynthesis